MKKMICLLLVMVCLFTGCSRSDTESTSETPAATPVDPDALTGIVFHYLSEFNAFTFSCDDSTKSCGIRIGPDTEMIWNITEENTFRTGLEVAVVLGEPTNEPGTNTQWYLGDGDWYYAEKIYVTEIDAPPDVTYAKPVIYLYPEAETDVTVKLNYDGQLTCTYPAYRDGWSVTAAPDGTLTDAKGQSYNYLYWEGEGIEAFDFSQGFCIAGADTAAFLEDALEKLGLNRREANEFIVYWLPLMEGNPYNLISFQTDAYTSHAGLEISPAPDTLIRVFMAWKPLEQAVDIPAQNLTAPARSGFTVVEWGGSQIE